MSAWFSNGATPRNGRGSQSIWRASTAEISYSTPDGTQTLNVTCRLAAGFDIGRKGRTQMIQHATETAKSNLAAIKALTFLMFMMFAMTTDSVGVIIPEIIKQFGLSMTAAGAFHYATMGGIALAGFFLGYLADKLGRKTPS